MLQTTAREVFIDFLPNMKSCEFMVFVSPLYGGVSMFRFKFIHCFISSFLCFSLLPFILVRLKHILVLVGLLGTRNDVGLCKEMGWAARVLIKSVANSILPVLQ